MHGKNTKGHIRTVVYMANGFFPRFANAISTGRTLILIFNRGTGKLRNEAKRKQNPTKSVK
jgi:hypothetical protein